MKKMMKYMKVQVVSKETIKPSSPTPPHLRTYNFSLIDQHIPQLLYIPFILFYSPNIHHKDHDDDHHRQLINIQTQSLDRLKTSLSETLTLYYPLAGRIKNDSIICCEDEGVEFVHTKVIDSPLLELVNKAEPENLAQLLPRHDHQRNEKPPLLSIQFNAFECGGMAIGLWFSHKVADSSSLCTFLHNWASIARGSLSSTEILCPRFDCATHFPPKQLMSPLQHVKTKGEVVSRRYIFDASMIAALKAKASTTINRNSSSSISPSRVLAVIAFLWRTVIAMDREKQLGSIRPLNMGIAVSLRSKMELTLPELSFGNLVAIGMTSAFHEQEVVERIGDLFGKFNRDYVKKLQSGEEYLKLMESLGELEEQICRGEAERYGVTSWCRFPFYEVDFGWGKPVWANVAAFEDNNFFVLMDTRFGEGIEVWVSLGEDDMARFQRQLDRELLVLFNSFSSVGSA